MNIYNFDPEKKEMAQHVTSGIASSGVVQIVKVLCQFGSVIILSRLLPPSDFGIIAMVAPVYSFIIIFHDMGLSQATIQRPRLCHEEVNAFFWLNVGVGMILGIATIALSPVVGWYYHEERIVHLCAAMGGLIVIGALGNQHGAVLQRRLEFSRLAIIDVSGTICSLVISVIMAIVLRGYWALYCGMAMGVIVPVAGVWLASGWRPSFPRFVPGLLDMLKFGAGITSFNLTCFIAGNTDNILVGRVWGDRELGFYDRAYKLLLFPIQRIVSPIAGTMIPMLSRLVDEPEKYRSIINNTLEQLIFAVWPGIIWAIIMSDRLIPEILGENWKSAVAIFIPLGIASLVQIFNSPPVWMFISQGRSGDYARWGVVNALTSIAAFVIGLPYGVVGVATAYAVSEYVRTPFLWWYCTRKGPVEPFEVLGRILPHIASAMVSALALVYFRELVDGQSVLIIAAGLVISYAVFALTMSLFDRGRKTMCQTAIFAGHLLLHIYPSRRKPV